MASQSGGQRPEDTKRESYHSSESESKGTIAGVSSSAGRKRPSRAGTRSVNTLSAAQLERKRANDREAQRAIRQRTKEHIEQLERRVAELSSGGSGESHMAALKRIKELEDENQILRARIDQQSGFGGFSDSSPVSSNWEESSQVRTQPRPESSATFPPMQQWHSGASFGSSSNIRPGEIAPEHAGAWRADRSRSTSHAVGAEGMSTLPTSMAQSQDMSQYTYSLGAQAAQPRAASQPSIYQHGQEQQIRQLSEQLGLSPSSAAAQYGPVPPHQQQQQQQQQRYGQPPQHHHQQTQGGPVQGPGFTPQNPQGGQSIFYGSYPRQ